MLVKDLRVCWLAPDRPARAEEIWLRLATKLNACKNHAVNRNLWCSESTQTNTNDSIWMQHLSNIPGTAKTHGTFDNPIYMHLFSSIRMNPIQFQILKVLFIWTLNFAVPHVFICVSIYAFLTKLQRSAPITALRTREMSPWAWSLALMTCLKGKKRFFANILEIISILHWPIRNT